MVEIRRATLADARILHDVARITFPLACPPGSDPRDIEKFINDNLSVEAFAAYLSDPSRLLFLAVDGDEPVGYTMLITGEPADADVASAVQNRPTVELSKVYVLPDRHGGGVSGALIAASVAAVRALGASSIWLGVNQHNARANRFYDKQGFERVGVRRFLLGTDWQDDYVRELVFGEHERRGAQATRSTILPRV